MKTLTVIYATAFYYIKEAFELLTHPYLLLVAIGAMLLRIIQIAW